MKCVNTSSYPMHIFKELHNKLLATNSVAELLRQSSKFTFKSAHLASLDKKLKMAETAVLSVHRE